ncbi:MAG: hypothetical protein EA359_15530 [Balneolaceae bacterium]|nr:MAG: hypothetical protein EA359_15530 [Balneolaceae bacterium]
MKNENIILQISKVFNSRKLEVKHVSFIATPASDPWGDSTRTHLCAVALRCADTKQHNPV